MRLPMASLSREQFGGEGAGRDAFDSSLIRVGFIGRRYLGVPADAVKPAPLRRGASSCLRHPLRASEFHSDASNWHALGALGGGSRMHNDGPEESRHCRQIDDSRTTFLAAARWLSQHAEGYHAEGVVRCRFLRRSFSPPQVGGRHLGTAVDFPAAGWRILAGAAGGHRLPTPKA